MVAQQKQNKKNPLQLIPTAKLAVELLKIQQTSVSSIAFVVHR